MKMRFFILIVMITVMFCSGCSSSSSTNAMINVIARYPTAIVRTAPESTYKFLVQLPDGSVRYVKCLNFRDDEISYDMIFFHALK